MTHSNSPNKPRITRLPPNGPKPGQSTESWLRGKARADAEWNEIRDRNLTRLLPKFNKGKLNG